MSNILLVGYFFFSITNANATSFQKCMDTLQLKGNADTHSIYEVISIASKSDKVVMGKNSQNTTSKVSEILVLTPGGTTKVTLGTNGCTSEGKSKGNVYDYIVSLIDNSVFEDKNGVPSNQYQLKEKQRQACRGIDPYLDQKLGPGSDRPAEDSNSNQKTVR